MIHKTHSMDRRSFVRLGAITTGLTMGGTALGQAVDTEEDNGGMKFRPLGKTGLKVSEISFGSYGFNNPTLLSRALDAGINFICTCADYQNGAAEEAIGKAISKISDRRDELVVFTGTNPRKSKKEILDTIDQSLKRLQTDRIEVFKAHNVDDPAALQVDDFLEAFEEAKKAGKVLHLALSAHGRNLEKCLNTAIDSGHYDVLQCKYNFMSYKDQEEIFKRAAQKGIGTVAFKIGAGEQNKEIEDLEKGGLSFAQASAKWALSNPAVSSVCAGITNFDQIKEYCGAVGKKLGRAEIEMLERYASIMHDRYCRHCGVCEESCPYGVAVSDVMRYAMYFKYYRREKDSMQLYAQLPKEQTASACLACDGACDGACPYGRRIQQGLLEAHEMLV